MPMRRTFVGFCDTSIHPSIYLYQAKPIGIIKKETQRNTKKTQTGQLIHITEANEVNFAVFCRNFAQKFLTNQKLLKFRSGIPDSLDGYWLCPPKLTVKAKL